MANEKQLIDPNALVDEISSLTIHITGLRAGKGVLEEFMKEYRKSVLRIVEESPTVDAVEVVRCKDCKRYSQSGLCNLYLNVSHQMKPDDFCSYGERRSDG